jgi:hypothetical protein
MDQDQTIQRSIVTQSINQTITNTDQVAVIVAIQLIVHYPAEETTDTTGVRHHTRIRGEKAEILDGTHGSGATVVTRTAIQSLED